MSAAKRIKPLLDRVLILKNPVQTKTKSGICLTEKGQDKVSRGTVLAVGPGRCSADGDLIPMSLRVGDKVLLPEYGGMKVASEDKEDNQDIRLFRETDILGLLQD